MANKQMQPQLIGIVNVTPDSFADGGQHATPQSALSHAKQLIADGADIIDIGAESTRPNATPLTHTQEWQRLQPILVSLALELPHAKISLDSYHPQTAAKALELLPIHMINDVSGADNPAMLHAIAPHDCLYVCMHHLGIPADKQVIMAEPPDLTVQLLEWWQAKQAHIIAHGIAKERLIFDPGIGFGKNAAQSLAILKHIQALKAVNVPLYVGHSEKSFLANFTDLTAGKRTDHTVTTSLYLQKQQVDYLRVHDVAAHVQAFQKPEITPHTQALWNALHAAG